MSDDKFHVIGETRLGTLDENMKAELDRLQAAQDKLEFLQAQQDEAQEAFWDAINRQFGERADELNATPRFRVTPEGDVFIDFCKCPVCQAQLHGMTVTAVVEEMFKNDLIPHQVIDHVRQRAKMVDSHQETRKKMMN